MDVKTGKVLWKTRLGTSVQGYPISFAIDGKQYIAVTTGLGGGSPRDVPRVIAPEIHHPGNGNALYVFALPDRPLAVIFVEGVMTKREFLTAGIGAGLALAGTDGCILATIAGPRLRPVKPKPPNYSRVRKDFPTGLPSRRRDCGLASKSCREPKPPHIICPNRNPLTEEAWLVDWNGKLLKTVTTPSRNTSGMAVGGGYVWMVANAPPEGVFQVDMNSRLVSHRQIPLGPANDGGGCHGALWQDGKLWIASLRLRGNLRVDPKTWEPEFLIPFYQAPDRVRYHGIAWDDGTHLAGGRQRLQAIQRVPALPREV